MFYKHKQNHTTHRIYKLHIITRKC